MHPTLIVPCALLLLLSARCSACGIFGRACELPLAAVPCL